MRFTSLSVRLGVLVVVIIVDLGLNPATEKPESQDREPAAHAVQPTTTPAGTPVPAPSATPYAIPATAQSCTVPHDWGPYAIQRGDSLSSLTQQYNTDVETLMRVNCLETDLIYVDELISLRVDGWISLETSNILSRFASIP